MRKGGITRVAVAATVALVLGVASTTASAAASKAQLLPGGRAIAPPSAPSSVKAMIEAANRIRRRACRRGRRHRYWRSLGYDCSGSVSYVMHAAVLLEWPPDSTGFIRWGK